MGVKEGASLRVFLAMFLFTIREKEELLCLTTEEYWLLNWSAIDLAPDIFPLKFDCLITVHVVSLSIQKFNKFEKFT